MDRECKQYYLACVVCIPPILWLVEAVDWVGTLAVNACLGVGV